MRSSVTHVYSARADAGNVKLKTHDFYLNELLADCCRSVQTLAAARQIALECRSPEDLQFRGDEELLRRLVINLLDNAMKYTPDGGMITVGTRSGTPGWVEIFVRDTGVGIPAEDVPRLFERFYRVDKARSRELGGTGLGLAIVKHLVLAQGGEVRVESVLGEGSTFSFTLPVETLDPAPEVHPQFMAS